MLFTGIHYIEVGVEKSCAVYTMYGLVNKLHQRVTSCRHENSSMLQKYVVVENEELNCLCTKIILGSLFSIIDSLSHKKVKVVGRGGKIKNYASFQL